MKVHIITIFPESFESYFGSSMIGKAISNGYFQPVFYKLNDFSDDNFKRVDGRAFGMHGQVIRPEPLSKAIEFIFNQAGKKVPVIYLTPSGKLLKQFDIENYISDFGEEFIVICGHYEGIDQRIIDLYVDYEISIGEYVLTSGELGAMVLLDSIIRFIPGVLGSSISLEEDSYSEKFNGKKEYPIYTRPQEFNGLSVPDVLISGNHKKIEEWKNNNLK